MWAMAPLASRALLLDVQQSRGRLVAVGERGHILVSTDDAVSWRQVEVPTRSTLTGVAFAEDGLLLAVGHGGVILRSRDFGETWNRIPADVTEEESFLDVLFVNPQNAIAVGAYGLFLESQDGGTTWQRREVAEEGFHFNRITRSLDGTLYIAGEAGTVLRSMDAAGTWDAIPTPYEGSFFGIIDLPDDTQLVFGLRGHVFRTESRGDDWEQINVPVPTLLMSGAILPDGRIVLAGQSGNFVVGDKSGRTFKLWKWGATTGVAEILPLDGGALLVLGEAGAVRVKPPGDPAPSR
jgi:photosystem II stability/assembly factor-like uncharacterized protein